MDKAALDKVIERIKKLMALSRSPNEHEAARAAERAQALLAEYNLSQADVVEDTGDHFEIDKELETNSYPWRRSLGTVLARLFFCEYYYDTFKRGKTAYDKHCFVGLRHNVVVLKLMFGYLITTVDRLAREGALTVDTRQRSPYRVSFRTACTNRLCMRIEARILQAKQGGLKSETGTALVVLDLYEKAEMQLGAFLEDKGLVFRDQRLVTLHDKGVRDGAKAGDEIGLDQQIERHRPKAIG